MNRTGLCASIVTLIVCATASRACAATMDFESVPRTLFGAAFGDAPADVVLTQNGITMSVEELLVGSFTGFIEAEVGGWYGNFFPTVPIAFDNISAMFAFSGVGFDVTLVTLDYQEFGGTNNFAVNGHDLLQISPLTDLPEEVAPGIHASVHDGVITLAARDGNIDRFLIGGQELAIDNVVALPAPPTVLLLAFGSLLLPRRHRP